MASHYELELTLTSAKQLKNVNWRHGTNKPYAVVYIDPIIKFTTNIDQNGNTESQWKNQTLILPLPSKPIKDLILYIQIVHAGFEEITKKLIGSARLKVIEVFENGIGKRVSRMLTLERPSGRPQGKVEVKVGIRESCYCVQGVDFGNEEFKSRECSSTSRLPQQRYNAGGYTASYGEVRGKRKSEFGEMGIGFAVGAVAGILGELAFEKGVEYIEDRIVDEVVERVEDDLGSSDDDVAENVEDDGDDDDDDDDNVAENVEDDVGYDDDMGEIVDDDFGYDDDDDGYDGDDF